jgi:hypothetical protein
MKRLIVTLALALVALPACAAIQYEFYRKSVTEDAVVPATDLTARAIVDGRRSRVDFVSGNLYPPGTYVISTDGARRLYFIDPLKKSYTEFNTSGTATSLGASNIKITNLQSRIEKLSDRPVIAGIETEHHQVIISYDITVMMKAIPLKQSVTTVIDNWTTTRFPVDLAVASNLRTGNPDIDQLLDIENSKLTGFPMRQTVTTKTNASLAPRKSELKLSPTRTMTREMWVTAIRETAADPLAFTIPSNFERSDTPNVPRSTTEVLTFEPASK